MPLAIVSRLYTAGRQDGRLPLGWRVRLSHMQMGSMSEGQAHGGGEGKGGGGDEGGGSLPV